MTLLPGDSSAGAEAGGRLLSRVRKSLQRATANASATAPQIEALEPRLLLSSTAFLQDDGPQGLVVMEAEHYDQAIAKPTHAWVLDTSYTGYAGSGAMAGLPNDGENFDPDYVANAPRLDWQIEFTHTGTHYIWVRGIGPDYTSDSVHFGLDGQPQSTSDRHTNMTTSWLWSRTTMDGVVLAINVATTGLHTLNAWMREDGFVIDRLLLTTSSSYTPGGVGPAESATFQLNIGSISGAVWEDLNGDGLHDEGETGMAGVTVFLDDNDNGQLDPDERSVLSAADDPNTTGIDETGQYLFDELESGQYVVAQVVPHGYIQTSLANGPISLAVGEDVAGVNLGNYKLVTPTAGLIDLDWSSDSGSSNSDNLTFHNNSAPNRTLLVSVSDTLPGATVRLYADDGVNPPMLIGQALASGTTTSITSDGSTVLPDGAYTLYVTQTHPDYHPDESAPSPGLAVTIDATPPRVFIDPLVTEQARPSITGTIDDSAATAVFVIVEGIGYGIYPAGSTTWSVPADVFGPLMTGVYNVVAQVGDLAGNIGIDTTTDELQILPSSGALSGFVWADANGDGIQGADEFGQQGVLAYLDFNNNSFLDWTDTNGNGLWDSDEGEPWVRTMADDPATPLVNETGYYTFGHLPITDYHLVIEPSDWQRITTGGSEVWVNYPLSTQRIQAPIEYRGLNFGMAVAECNGRILATANLPLQNGYLGGAYVYHATSDGYRLEAELLIPQNVGMEFYRPDYAAMNDQWVALSGWTSDPDYEGPAVAMFHRVGSTWTFVTVLRPTGVELTHASEWKGAYLAMDGDLLVVTSIWSQQAWAFELQGDAWQEVAELTPSDLGSHHDFGTAVAIDAGTIVIGAKGQPDALGNTGALYVYERVDGVWTQTDKLLHVKGGQGQLGTSIDIKGDLIVSGGPNRTGSQFVGYAYVYRRTPDLGWQYEQRLEVESIGYAQLGTKVAIVGTRIAAWAPGAHSTFIFEWDGQAWEDVCRLEGDFSGSRLLTVDDSLLMTTSSLTGTSMGNNDLLLLRPIRQPYRAVVPPGDAQPVGIKTIAPTVLLLSASDTGSNNHDRVTRYNNHDASTRLTFYVGEVESGSSVAIHRDDGALLGSGIVYGHSLQITTNGTTPLPDGLQFLEVRIRMAGSQTWQTAQWIDLVVDSVAPVVQFEAQSTVALQPTLHGQADQPQTQVLVSVAGHEVTAQVDDDGHWMTPAGALPALAVGVYDVQVQAVDLAGNTSSTLFPAALTLTDPAQIEGVIWRDRNGDGQRDADELGMAGVPVFLDLNHNGWWDPDEPKQISAADDPGTAEDESGRYIFTQLSEGDYVVRIDLADTAVQVTSPGTVANQWGHIVRDQTLTAPAATQYSGYGHTFSVSEHVLVVGSAFASASYYHGSVGIYERAGYDQPWELVTYLDETPMGLGHTYLGYSVAATDQFVFIGAPNDRDGNPSGVGTAAGAFYVFERDADTGQWTQRAKITGHYDQITQLGFGMVADEHTLVVGAPGGYGDVGNALVFERDESDPAGWRQVALLEPTAAAGTSSYFSWTMALQDDLLAIGAYRDSEFGSYTGAVYLYRRNAADPQQWELIQTIANPTSGRYFGEQLAITGNSIVAGDGTHVFIFEPDLSNPSSWVFVAQPQHADLTSVNSFTVGSDLIVVNGDSRSVVLQRSDGDPAVWLPVKSIRDYRQAVIDGQYLLDSDPTVGSASQGAMYVYRFYDDNPWWTLSLQPAEVRTMVDFGVHQPSPQLDQPVLQADSDTGIDQTDHLTRFNNADPDHVLSFDVTGVVDGATVSLFADGILIGQAISTGQPVTVVTTDGQTALPDGVHKITVAQTIPGLDLSLHSASLTITIDATAPVVDVDDIITPDAKPPLTGSITDDSDCTLLIELNEPGQFVQATIDGDRWSVPQNILGPYEDGHVPIHYQASDAAGNVIIGVDDDSLFINQQLAPVISINDVTMAEGNDGITRFTFTVTASEPMLEDTWIRATPIAGTATGGIDFDDRYYKAVFWYAGQGQSISFDIDVYGDTEIEANETFFVDLSIEFGTVQIVKSRGVGTIINDDPTLPPGDANGDGVVNLADLQILGDYWRSNTADWSMGDFNGDGVVNLGDLQILVDNWNFGLPQGVA